MPFYEPHTSSCEMPSHSSGVWHHNSTLLSMGISLEALGHRNIRRNRMVRLRIVP